MENFDARKALEQLIEENDPEKIKALIEAKIIDEDLNIIEEDE